MKKVIITGAGGFIGSALAKSLAAGGNKVYALLYSEKEIIRYNSEKNITLLIGDLNNYKELLNEVNEEIDCFVHLAWAGISSADYKDILVQKSNFEMSICAVAFAKELKAKRFIFCGTNQEYLVSKNTVDGSLSAASVYGTCKLCARKICETLCKDTMIFNATAFTNVFGVGDYSKRTANIFISKLLKNEPLDLIEGNNLYDWTYITDAVEGLTAVIQKGINGKQYYIGSRDLITFKEIIIKVRDIISPKTELNFGKFNDQSFADYSRFDLDALYNDTGFECKSDFRESILKTAEWVESLNWEA